MSLGFSTDYLGMRGGFSRFRNHLTEGGGGGGLSGRAFPPHKPVFDPGNRIVSLRDVHGMRGNSTHWQGLTIFGDSFLCRAIGFFLPMTVPRLGLDLIGGGFGDAFGRLFISTAKFLLGGKVGSLFPVDILKNLRLFISGYLGPPNVFLFFGLLGILLFPVFRYQL